MLAWQYVCQSRQSPFRKDQRISLAFSFWRTGFPGKGFSHGDPQNHRTVRIMEHPNQKWTHKYHWKKIGWYWSHSENITHCPVTTLRSLPAGFLQSCSETRWHWNRISLAFRQTTLFWLQTCSWMSSWRRRERWLETKMLNHVSLTYIFHFPSEEGTQGCPAAEDSGRCLSSTRNQLTEMMHGFLSVFSPDTCRRKISFLTFSPWIV